MLSLSLSRARARQKEGTLNWMSDRKQTQKGVNAWLEKRRRERELQTNKKTESEGYTVHETTGCAINNWILP